MVPCKQLAKQKPGCIAGLAEKEASPRGHSCFLERTKHKLNICRSLVGHTFFNCQLFTVHSLAFNGGVLGDMLYQQYMYHHTFLYIADYRLSCLQVQMK